MGGLDVCGGQGQFRRPVSLQEALMPDIIAVTRDDISHRFPCASSTYVLDAAEEAGLYLPSVCRHGRCGTCRAQVISGTYDLAPHEAPLPPGPGSVLLCRCLPREDLVVALPCRDAQIGRRKVPERRAVITAVALTSEWWGTLSLQLRREGEYGQAADFHAGQYMELRIPGTDHWQALAMANLPNEEGTLEFLVIPRPGEAFAAWAAKAKPGEELQLRGPLGKFALDETSPRPRLLVGAGAGLAPLLAMLRHLASIRDRTRVHFICEASLPELPFLERSLASLRAALPQLTIALAPGGAAAALGDQLAKLTDPDIYVCGPQPMLAAVLAAARAEGVAAARIRAEPAGVVRDGAAGILVET
jgi:NAD(P)H-flavin reductase/ferredoxin